VAVLRVSPEDPRIADYGNVPDPDLLASRGVFVAEGRHVVRRLLTESRLRTRSLLLTAPALDALGDLVARLPDLPIFVVDQSAMHGITGFNIHRGCLAIGERPAPVPWTDLVRDARRVVVLEGVANADNVGGIFRNAAAFGADAVLFGPACADPLYRKTIRTSMGAALRVPFAAMSDWPADVSRLGERGFAVVALTPGAGAEPLRGCAAALHDRRVALLVGHEGDGLSDGALKAAGMRARIPTTNAVDSLNVAAATAIALYELTPEP
jgi:tRNA G18 (ribose-2'-O)-methylase SpoU